MDRITRFGTLIGILFFAGLAGVAYLAIPYVKQLYQYAMLWLWLAYRNT